MNQQKKAANQQKPPQKNQENLPKQSQNLDQTTIQKKLLNLDKLKFWKKRSSIQEIVREPTSGGVIFRLAPGGQDIEILLIQDSKDRWTIPKGHVEPGETAKQTAIREIGEEAGLKEVDVMGWLGKIHFKYRRVDKLVLMTTQVYLVRALGNTDRVQKEEWMKGIKWFSFTDALDAIEYEDIEKLMLLAKKRVRQAGLLKGAK